MPIPTISIAAQQAGYIKGVQVAALVPNKEQIFGTATTEAAKETQPAAQEGKALVQTEQAASKAAAEANAAKTAAQEGEVLVQTGQTATTATNAAAKTDQTATTAANAAAKADQTANTATTGAKTTHTATQKGKGNKPLNVQVQKEPVRQFKKKKPNISGKEGAKDVPDWVKEEGWWPYVGESGKDFAKRVLDEKYGPIKHKKGSETEFSQIQKWADRSFE